MGILQGEPLSPLLFSLFVADLESYFRDRGTRGINIDGHNDVIMLLYADDLILLSDSEVDMNRKLLILEGYCSQNMLEVNTNKSRVVCFRTGGYAHSQNISIFYKNNRLQVSKEYTYLGVTFTSSSLFLKNSGNIVRRAQTAIGAVMQLLVHSKSKSWEVKMTLYNTIIINTLSYCSAIWSLRYTHILERVQVGFFKRLLCVPRNTPDYFVRLETGTVKLAFVCFKLALNLFIKVISMPSHRYPFLCVQRLISLDRQVSQRRLSNWVGQLRSVYELIGLSSLWTPNDVQLLCNNKMRVLDTYCSYLHDRDIEALSQSSYGLYYRSLSPSQQSSDYLSFPLPIKITRVVAQIRLASRKRLSIFSPGIVCASVDLTATCTVCNLDEPETLEHMLLRCPAYRSIRAIGPISVPASSSDIVALLNNLTPDKCRFIFSIVQAILRIRTFILDE